MDKLNFYIQQLENISFEKFNRIDKFPHKNILLNKLKNTLEGKQPCFKSIFDAECFLNLYLNYVNKIINTLLLKSSYEKRTLLFDLFEQYKSDAKNLNKKYGSLYFNAQSKYESSINEEFLILFFLDLLEDNLKIGSSKIKSMSKDNIFYDPLKKSWNSQVYIDYKDQDLCIYFEENKDKKIIFAAEIKSSYIDKTMLHSINSTFNDLKKENPKVMTAVITEAITIDPYFIFDRNIHIYCLKKANKRDPNSELNFDRDVFEKMYIDIQNHIQYLKSLPALDMNKIIQDGYL